MADKAKELTLQYEAMVNARGTWEEHWTEIADRIWPRMSNFQSKHITEGSKRTSKMFDSSPALALERFSAAVESLLTPRASTWHFLRASMPELDRIAGVREFFDALTRRLFQLRYRPAANFASQTHENYMSLGAFGSGGIMTVEADSGVGFMYRSCPLSGLYFAQNDLGIVDKKFMRRDYTLRQVAMRWGVEALSPSKQKRLIKNPEEKLQVVHGCMPRKDRDPSSLHSKNKPFGSYWFDPEDQKMLSEGGFDEDPYTISRYVVAPSETYGRSPAMTVLADIKMLNAMSETTIKAAQKVVDPPLIVSDDGVFMPIRTNPGGHTFARLDGRSRMPIEPLQTGARIDIGLDMMQQRREVINDAFLITLFQILVETPQMTATEVMERAQEKGALLAPTVGRQQSEFLGPLIERELGIMARQKLIPEMPPELIEAEGEYTIDYVSPLTRAQRADEGTAILRTLEGIQPIAAVDPSVMGVFDLPEMARTLADINGMPVRMIKSPEEFQKMLDQQQQQEAQANALEQAPNIADAALKGGQAANEMGIDPRQLIQAAQANQRASA